MAVTLTVHFNLPKPDPEANVDEEFVRLQTTLDAIDAVMKTIADDAASRAAGIHAHSISEITGLSTALAGKMPASQTFSLDDLSDVSGAAGAGNGYVLVKSTTGWVPSTAIAALGTHGHLMSEVSGLADALASKADTSAVITALAGKSNAGHGHAIADVTGLQTALDAKAPQSDTYTKAEVVARDARFLYARDQKAAGSSGGGNASGWNIRELNTVVNNTIAGASLAANSITLPAGTYELQASAPGFRVGNHTLRIVFSDSTPAIVGTDEFSATGSDYCTTRSFVSGKFTLLASASLQLSHYTSNVKTVNGFGTGNSSGVVGVFSEVKIWRVD